MNLIHRMTEKIFEVNGVIPDTTVAKMVELAMSYPSEKTLEPIFDYNVIASLNNRYGNFSLPDLPDKDVFEHSKKIIFSGGEKANIEYDPEMLSNNDVYNILTYGIDHEKQPEEIMKAARDIVSKNNIERGSVIICPDHGLGAAVQLQIETPAAIVSYDWHADKKPDEKYTRASWLRQVSRNSRLFGFENKPTAVRATTRLTEKELEKVRGKTAVTVCLDVLQPYFADAVINLRKNGGMNLEDLMKDIKMLQKRNDVVSLSICERRRILDDKENTASTIRDIVEGFMKN